MQLVLVKKKKKKQMKWNRIIDNKKIKKKN